MHARWQRSLHAAYHYALSSMSKPQLEGKDNSADKLDVYKRAYEREKARREYVEKMLEDKTRELYMSSQELTSASEALDDAFIKIESQSDVITGLSNDYNRVTEDLSYAAKIQSSLLPKALDLDKISIIGEFKAAQYLAGDGFDYFQLNENIFAFYIIDVVGHGSAAAMVSFAVQVLLNPKRDGICQKHLAASGNLNDAVENTLKEINQNFYQSHTSSQYFTMIYGLLNLANGHISLGQAGHPTPILLDSSSNQTSLQGKGGMPVAMFDDPNFGIYECKMNSGDRLFVYSDGITECRNDNDEEFGTDKLMANIESSAHLKIQQSADSILDTITSWNSKEDFEDDISLLVLEYQ